MRTSWALGVLLVSGGYLLAKFDAGTFSTGAWCTGVILLVFAVIGRAIVRRETTQ